MITVSILNELLNHPESNILDFKRELYDFTGNLDRANAALVKDVCAMINTVRSQTSYILFGVDAPVGSPVNLVGLPSSIDDAIIQEKVKNKIIPRPEFSYYTVSIDNVLIGVMEFPLRRYEMPVTPSVNLSSAKSGVIYHRLGSSNTEATGTEGIRIYEWLRSLPAPHTIQGKHDELILLLQQLQQAQLPLAPTLPKMLALGRKYNLQHITDFSLFELGGVESAVLENDEPYQYRLQKVFIDFGASVRVNNGGFTAAQVKEAIRGQQHFIESDLHMGQSVHEMETLIGDMAINSDMRFGVLNGTSKTLMPWYKGNDTPVRIYLFPDDLTSTVRRIRQKAIDLVIEELN